MVNEASRENNVHPGLPVIPPVNVKFTDEMPENAVILKNTELLDPS